MGDAWSDFQVRYSNGSHGSPPAARALGTSHHGGSQESGSMTYCVGVLLKEGMVLASDSRTHAGIDNIAKFCKMSVFEREGDRVIVLLSSGNLAGTQAVIGILNRNCAAGDAAA